MDRSKRIRADPSQAGEMRIEHKPDRPADAAQAAGQDQHQHNPYDHRPDYSTYWVPGREAAG